MTSGYHDHPSVRHAAATLASAGHPHAVVKLDDTARSAAEAAAALGVPVGAIVKTLAFTLAGDNRPVIALVSGDRQCDMMALGRIFGDQAGCNRPRADFVKAATGYAIGGVSPIGLPAELAIVMDSSLQRFDVVWAAAGHPHCVFQASPDSLRTLTGARLDSTIASAP